MVYLLTRLPGLLGVVRGEGEEPLVGLVKQLASLSRSSSFRNVPDFSFYESGKIVNSSLHSAVDLNHLPLPQWDLFDLESYQKHNGQLILPAQFSRGCRFQCRFCSTPHFQNFKVRSIKSFMEELRNDINKWDCRVFRFGDSTFNFDRNICKEVCKSISKLGSDIRWGAYARVDNIDDEMASAFQNSGCYYLYLGIESGNNKILRLMRKGYGREQIIEAVDLLRKYGIKVMCSFIVGFPGESEETIHDTRELIHMIQPDAGFAFPFEARDHTEVLSLFSVFGPKQEYLENIPEQFSANSPEWGKRFVSEYGRLLAREFIPWQNTNVLMNWLDILEITRDLQSVINQYAEYNGEAEILAQAGG